MADGDNSQGLTDLNTTQKSGVQYLGQILLALRNIFPQTSGTSTTATGGAATLPANPVGFITVKMPDGTTKKIAYYGD